MAKTKRTVTERGEKLREAYRKEKETKRAADAADASKFFEERSKGSSFEKLHANDRAAKNKLADMAETDAESLHVQASENSREQYKHEKEQGDPYAISMSFEEWKKL